MHYSRTFLEFYYIKTKRKEEARERRKKGRKKKKRKASTHSQPKQTEALNADVIKQKNKKQKKTHLTGLTVRLVFVLRVCQGEG